MKIMDISNITVVIPTYNESQNIEGLLDGIVALNLKGLHILVVDDDSPDGTWRIVEDYSRKDPAVRLLRRSGKRGRGLGGIEGFREAVKNSDVIIEMDGDFSHHPKYIPLLLENLKEADIVIASRYVKGGVTRERGLMRKMVSIFAAYTVRICWRINVKDPTSGYRCFRRGVLNKILRDGLRSDNQFIILEVLKRVHENGFSIKEVPISFYHRRYGHSKLSPADLVKCFLFTCIKTFG